MSYIVEEMLNNVPHRIQMFVAILATVIAVSALKNGPAIKAMRRVMRFVRQNELILHQN
jgi:hypothetical protein